MFGIGFSSRWALRLSLLVAITTGVAAAIAAAIVGYTFMAGALPESTAVLLIPASLIVVAGQLWTIAVLIGRLPVQDGGTWPTLKLERGGMRLRDLRGGLSWRAAGAFLVLFYSAGGLGIFSARQSWSVTSNGVPVDDPVTCQYTVEEHGLDLCLTRSEYERREVGLQRFVVSMLCAFFIAQCGLTTGEVLYRRRHPS